MKHVNILVLGGTGFIGRQIVSLLAERGARVTVPTRRRDRARHLILLPTVDVVEADVSRPGVLEALAPGHDAVINLVGVLHSRPADPAGLGGERYGEDFFRAHVELPQHVVNACRVAGVRRVLHMSALGAAQDAPSEYLHSKGVGERAMLAAEDLEVTAFRPSVVFGPGDAFLNTFAALSAWTPLMAVASPEARFQPVYVGDVAQAFVHALDDRDAIGRCYDLVGPRVLTLRELVRYACQACGRRRPVLGLGPLLSSLQARVLEKLPGALLTRDNLRSMQVDNVSDAPLPFGLRATPMEAVVPGYLGHVAPKERYGTLRLRAKR